MEHMMKHRVNVMKFCVKLQKPPTGQMPVHGVETEEFPLVKKATNVKVQGQNNVDLLSRNQGYNPL
jgi:hypothetical protein